PPPRPTRFPYTTLFRSLYQAQKMEAIGNLTGGMAHDFNNMLSVIIGNLDLLRDLKGDDPDIDELTREALDAAFRGADLTRRLLRSEEHTSELQSLAYLV